MTSGNVFINKMAMMEGLLSKWTNVVKGWQFRWFVLDDNAGLLSYYISKEKMMRGVRRGCVRLKGAVIGIDDDDDSTFTITVDGKIFHFQARDPDERDRWIRALEDTILRHAQFHQKRWNPNQPVPTVQDFDKKLTETDAYLQILIEQVKNLETRLEKCDDEAERHQCLVIRDRANEMLDSIKHSIVLLQIAKNTAHPVNGIYQRKSTSHLSGPSLVDGPRRVATIPSLVDAPLDVPIEPGIEPAVECLEEGAGASIKERLRATSSSALDLGMAAADVGGSKSSEINKTCAGTYKSSFQPVVPPGPSPAVILPIPETSYSSSEDEDYFDAKDDEYEDQRCAQSASGRRLYTDATDSVDSALRSSEKSTSSTNSILMDGRIDFDDAQKGLICGDESIYEDDDEEELGSVESHGSVISHLLSQVKLGMDLTKVVLPTFILERRSLLEMYADFFAHPDLFVSIADFADPKDRMVQVVRWYMSAFHAGRKSSVAKKPYNPILGETFRCYWDVPGIPESEEQVPDGPLPWATKNQLSFIAEQVSHHPPISAFYAEHYNKRISFCAHIWTKSKFLGLSIGVHMIGQGCISVLDSDEEYIISFPNGYGRSILSIPWVELGGSTTVSCAKTGYNANVSFLTKPFYGGKKHRVVAEVFQPSDKKPFLTVSGEWNGSMHAKWADGRTEEFVDTTSIPIIKKNVQPVANQEEFESRRLWKDVTAGLRLKNIEKATESKFHLEQTQRLEAKERKDRGTKWETKCFHENGENWIYDDPLVKRLASAAAAVTETSSTAITSSSSSTTTTTAEPCRTAML